MVPVGQSDDGALYMKIYTKLEVNCAWGCCAAYGHRRHRDMPVDRRDRKSPAGREAHHSTARPDGYGTSTFLGMKCSEMTRVTHVIFYVPVWSGTRKLYRKSLPVVIGH